MKNDDRGPTRRKLATARYEELGLDTYLGKKWGNVGTESGACTETFLKGYFTWEVTEHPAANTYYTLRYRPLKGTPAWALLAAAHPEWTRDEQFWSDWAPEQLAEGWLQTQFTNTYKLVERDLYSWKYQRPRDWQDKEIEGQYVEYPIYFIVHESGIRMKPLTVTGSRRMEGTIQTAYRSYLNAYLNVQEALNNYTMKMEIL